MMTFWGFINFRVSQSISISS